MSLRDFEEEIITIIMIIAVSVTVVLSLLHLPEARADHRMELDDAECHFVRPTGIANNNNGDEVKESNCKNSLITNNDGTRTGSVVLKRRYAPGTIPLATDYSHTSNGDTNIVCNMVDGNTTYQTNEWTVIYKPKIEDLEKFRKSFGTVEGDKKYVRDFDYNEDGVIDYLDLNEFRANTTGKVTYSLACYRGVAQ